ncbi:D-alanyl-D-alanine carboxypeptidase precursor [Enhygromyxa salina]|uniref:D-alanyl-D-alanine carboxypeptidase n=1 Tax=Enhygromyxa salina TaxID=215803 RepID=A0A2S9XFX7_9BACT|nr:D-alanyl-D-alanine carboxypeptidase [Enhygromyxa salina]PRP91660.1 D-alanyl-D-alanine carboxypeptidase precursor [Enhygromyxa salina]
MIRTTKPGSATSGSSVRLPLSSARRVPLFVLSLMVLGVLGLGLWWPRADVVDASPEIDVSPEPPSWVEGLVLIPTMITVPTPDDSLEARLAAFARRVEAVRATVEPPLVAFNSESLREDIEGTIGRIDDRAQVSVHIRDLDSGRVLFDYYGDTLLNPASNHKLLTTSAALDLLGSDYVFETRVILVGERLYLIGEGDPTIDGEALAELAAAVAERVPVATISEIVVDDSAFSPRAFGPGYNPEGWGASYLAPSGALSLNFNTVEITVYPIKGQRKPAVALEPDSTHVVVDNATRFAQGQSELDIRSHRQAPESADDETPREAVLTRVEVKGSLGAGSRGYKVRRRVVDPGMYTGGAFSLMLAEASQSERLPVRIGQAPRVYLDALAEDHGDGDHLELPQLLDHDEDADVLLVAVRRSPPLIDIVSGVLAYSNNFMAEQILRTLGWRMTGDPGDWDNGSEVVRGYWEALGNDPGGLVFENGAGMSSVGRITTTGLVDLMAVAARTQTAGASLIDALPVAGTVGTVRTRLGRSGKRVRAKTGTLNGVSGLTGVITTEAGEPQVAFSILINVREADHIAAQSRRAIEDAIVMAVLGHIDGWEATRGEMILDLEPIAVTPVE